LLIGIAAALDINIKGSELITEFIIEFINGNKRISCSPITDPLIDVSA